MNKTGNNEKPYERFEAFGASALTDAELLAIIIRTGTRDYDAVEIARMVLELGKYPRCGFMGLYDADISQLERIPGIGNVKAVKLKCLAEIALRMHETRLKEGLNVKNASTIAEYYMERLRHNKNENVLLLSIDSKGQVIRESEVSKGSVNRSLAHIRSIMLEALDAEAVNILLLHNHPSGDPKPSKDDRALTARLNESCRMMEIPLLDHIIIGDNRYYSFRESGELV
ncbi:MAG: DNA repair protein RadC [Lachnospiraceae bacterium]|nr:DNA repair protein RadC [Lachnospiraceae bacterium]MBP1585399.1 DNA repair protein RadC [Lachnospiraceae bacterium]